MKRIRHIALGITIATLMCLSAFAQVNQEEAFAIIDKVEENYTFDDTDFSTTVTLIVEKPNEAKRQMQFKMYRRDKKEQFTMIQIAPEADKGSGYLGDKENFWYYDPISRKFSHTSIKQNIGSSDSKTSDLAKSNSYRDHYNVTSMESGKLGSFDIWIFTLEAKTDEPTYAKSVFYVRKGENIILKIEDFSANNRLMRTTLFPKYAKVGNKMVATQAIQRDEINKGEQTQQIMTDISLSSIPDKVFTKAYLEQLN